MQNLSLRVMGWTFMATRTHVHVGRAFQILVDAVPVASLPLHLAQRAGFVSPAVMFW